VIRRSKERELVCVCLSLSLCLSVQQSCVWQGVAERGRVSIYAHNNQKPVSVVWHGKDRQQAAEVG